jgi:chromate reductase
VAKPAAVVGASTTPYGAQWAQEQIRRALTLSGAMVIDAELAVGHADTSVANGELMDQEARDDLERVVTELVAAVESIHAQERLAA